jgi:hypothetical protein
VSSDIQSVLFFASQSHHKYPKKKTFSGEVKESVIFPHEVPTKGKITLSFTSPEKDFFSIFMM